MQQAGQQTSPDPVRDLVGREALKVVRKSFLLFLVAAALSVVVVGALSFVFGGASYPWTGYEEILGFIIAFYTLIVYLSFKLKNSRGLGIHFYILGVLGLSQGGFLFSWGGESLLSAGYWQRQASSGQGCKCWRDNGDLVVVGGETLACLKCSRRIRIGYDIPKIWNRIGLAAIVVGIALIALYSLLPGIPGGLLITFLGYLLLFDGLVLGFFPFSTQQSLGGYVRIPVDQSEPANSAR